MRVYLLGRFEVSVGSRVVGEEGWRLRKAAGLVKLLALAPHHRLHREQAMEALWPDLLPRSAANNLHQTLHAARRALEPDARDFRYLVLRDELLFLCPNGTLWVDVDAFEEAAVEARRSGEAASYRRALELYTGDLLPRDRYEDWAEEQRAGLRRKYLALLSESTSSPNGRSRARSSSAGVTSTRRRRTRWRSETSAPRGARAWTWTPSWWCADRSYAPGTRT